MSPYLILAGALSGLGKVSLTASLPIMAATQVEVSVLPTIILSSHTGGFPHIYQQTAHQAFSSFLEQWSRLDIAFDGLVAGYLRSHQHIHTLLDFLNKRSIPLFLDPVMADDGKLYPGFLSSYIQDMRILCQSADVIIPNLTEAYFLLDIPYKSEVHRGHEIEKIVHKLFQLGPKHVIVTGIPLPDEQIGIAYGGSESRKNLHVFRRKYFLEKFFGVGDILTAILASSYFHGISLLSAIPLAMDFLESSLKSTLTCSMDKTLGIYYQPYLEQLSRQMKFLIGEKL